MVTMTVRIKEMIKVKEIGVGPAELEDLLLGHPKVEDVAVIGIADDYSGEVPKAFVVLASGYKGSQELKQELIGYVKERKIRHKWINVVKFVSMIPKSASGKILRRVLRDRSKKANQDLEVRDVVKEKAKM